MKNLVTLFPFMCLGIPRLNNAHTTTTDESLTAAVADAVPVHHGGYVDEEYDHDTILNSSHDRELLIRGQRISNFFLPCGSRVPTKAQERLMDGIVKAFWTKLQKRRNGDNELADTSDDVVVQLSDVVIDTYFHVIHDGTKGKLTDGEVEDQIDVLNQAFAGAAPGVDCDGQTTTKNTRNQLQNAKISFALREITRTENKSWFTCTNISPRRNFFVNSNARNEVVMKRALRRGDDCAVLNIYTLGLDNLLGWATSPDACVAGPSLDLDGVIVDYRTLPAGPTREHFDEGDTLVHEVGHWLGLYHTFQNGCAATGDAIADTPAERTPARGCPTTTTRDTCPTEPGVDPIHNFMDYTDDCCMYEFTNEQVIRMHSMIDRYRQAGQGRSSGGREEGMVDKVTGAVDSITDHVANKLNDMVDKVQDKIQTINHRRHQRRKHRWPG